MSPRARALRLHTILVLGLLGIQCPEVAASTNVANARRNHWRANVAGCETDNGFFARLDRTLSLLRAGQLDAGAPAAAKLLPRSKP